jgi:hypothetical protein
VSDIKQIIVDEPIAQIKFACDLGKCKGACCTLAGGTGAPLLDEELQQIKNSFPIVSASLPQAHLDHIKDHGLYEGASGSYTTICYDNRACVFVLYENGIAKCSFEKAFNEGKINWKKPISCHLFPIRVDEGITKRLRYERIMECDHALVRGEFEDIQLSVFLKEPLERAFGSYWYENFRLTCECERNKAVKTDHQ